MSIVQAKNQTGKGEPAEGQKKSGFLLFLFSLGTDILDL
jgi:hypothetical protein